MQQENYAIVDKTYIMEGIRTSSLGVRNAPEIHLQRALKFFGVQTKALKHTNEARARFWIYEGTKDDLGLWNDWH